MATKHSLTVFLPEPPSANKWWRRAGTHMHLSNEARAYKKMVAERAVFHRWKPLIGNVRVTLEWTRGRKSGDLDKRIGVVLDALQGALYVNDKQVVEIHAIRKDKKGEPSLMVVVGDV